MSFKEKLKRRKVTDVQYSVSDTGLHIRLNGFAEFVISKEILLKLNGVIFNKEIKENENKFDTSEQGQGSDSEAGI